MAGDFSSRAAGCWLHVVSRIVPFDTRTAWRSRYDGAVTSLAVLDRRGELVRGRTLHLGVLCRAALFDAVVARRGAFDWQRSIRGPCFLLLALATALLLLAVSSHGFGVTRSLIRSSFQRVTGHEASRLFGNLFPVVFAAVSGIIVSVGRISLRGPHWKYPVFLLLKTVFLSTILTLCWTEGGAALRAAIPNGTVRAMMGGLAPAILFIAAFDGAVIWSLADQQHRCPVCLRRFICPVRIGTWASVFEPVTTEWICDSGHGALCMREIATAESDRWLELHEPVVDYQQL